MNSAKWVIEATFRTPFIAHHSIALSPLPVALDLAGLYEHIVRRHIPIPSRSGECLAEQVARFLAIESKLHEQRQLQARLAKELQFNRKVELNAALRVLNSELKSLL